MIMNLDNKRKEKIEKRERVSRVEILGLPVAESWEVELDFLFNPKFWPRRRCGPMLIL